MTAWDDANRMKKLASQTIRDGLDTSLRRADREASKRELQDMLADAVRNTAAMPVERKR